MRILDLYCKAGGAAMGLHQAFPEAEIIGVDILPQPRYPFKFIQGNALEMEMVRGFDFVWASPPCQGYSEATPLHYRNRLPRLIAATRDLLRTAQVPYVIENVENARRHMISPVMLCGTMFGLEIWRHRYFETDCGSWLLAPTSCAHNGRPLTLHAGSNTRRTRKSLTVKEAARAMGIDWMIGTELNEAIPPAYSRYIGEQFLKSLERAA
jgi:DNA (cytosine-5)-methyltransferase 1